MRDLMLFDEPLACFEILIIKCEYVSNITIKYKQGFTFFLFE